MKSLGGALRLRFTPAQNDSIRQLLYDYTEWSESYERNALT
jgi:hypothetical protein